VGLDAEGRSGGIRRSARILGILGKKGQHIMMHKAEINNSIHRIHRWSGLRASMTRSYVLVTLIAAFVSEILHYVLYLLLPLPPVPWYILLGVDIFLLVFVPLTGALFGIISTQGLIQRIRGLVAATTRFADGDYSQRVQVSRRDEVGQLEEQFNRMAQQLVESIAQRQGLAEQNARLAERARLARDLHDSVKQQVFAVSMQLGAGLALLEQKPEVARRHLVEAENLAYHAQQELALLIQELRPLALQGKELAAALQEYTATWSRQSGIAADLRVADVGILPLPVEESLWRVTQEALSNVARHSHATSVRVSLACEHGKVTLAIMDNGQGFDTSPGHHSGVGLHSMQERMELLGGTVTVESKPEEGTRILVECPIVGDRR
jgi:two-component system, NarL family, sensor histidine kinase LiaS